MSAFSTAKGAWLRCFFIFLSAATYIIDLSVCNIKKGFNAQWGCFAKTKQPRVCELLSDAELCDAGSVTLDVLLGEVVEQVAALTDHFEKAAAGMVVLLVDLEVFGELVDALGENGDLNLRRTGVGLMGAVCLDNCLFLFVCDHSLKNRSFQIYNAL